MSNKKDWNKASQPAVHDYVENNFVVPWLEQHYNRSIILNNLENTHTKHADRFYCNDDLKISIERKHDGSDKSEQLAIELMANLPLHSHWKSLSGRIKKSSRANDHKEGLKKLEQWHQQNWVLRNTENSEFNRYAGLIFSTLEGLGKHYSVFVKHYPACDRIPTYLHGKTECWMVDTKRLQKEWQFNSSNIDIGATRPENYNDRWYVILAFLNMPSIHSRNKSHITSNCICGNWDISEVYPKLVDKLEVPDYLSNKYLYN